MIRIGYDAKRLFHNRTGLGNYSRNLLKSLVEQFPKNQYFLYNPKKTTIKFDASKDCYREVNPKRHFFKKHFLWRQFFIKKQLQEDNISLYHGLSGELPFGIHKTKIKTVVTIHDLIFIRYPNLYRSIDRYLHLKKFKYATTVADTIIAISEQTRRDIINYLNVSDDKIKVIYQGCHPIYKKLISKEKRQEILEKYYVPDSYILNVGTIEVRKNALSIVKAIRNINTFLVIVGNRTNYANKIEKYIQDEGLQKKVLLLQGLSLIELAALYQSAKIFVYPSIFEGFGIPIIEAMYSQTAVVTCKTSCLPEAAGPHSRYINDPYDTEMLSQHIVELLDNESVRKQQISLSYEFVQRFDDSSMAKAYMQVYQNLTSTSNEILSNQKSNKISCIIPTYNEETHIAAAIESAQLFANEIIVFDSYSTDRTEVIAREYDIRFIQRKFDNYSNQKNVAITHTTNNWVFILDADERVNKELGQEILTTTNNEKIHNGFYIHRENYFFNRKINHSNWQNDNIIRLFKKGTAQYNEALVHEKLIVQGSIGYLNHPLKHYSFINYDHYISKLNKYAGLQAIEIWNHNPQKRIYVYHLIVKPLSRFFIHYFIKGGFKDGFPGFIISFFGMYSVMLRYIKFWLLKQKNH